MSNEQPRVLVPCFVCGEKLDRVWNDAPMQPISGVMCSTSGNYGSGVLDGATIAFVVCDICLSERANRTRRMVTKRIHSETTYTEWPGV